MKLSSKYFEKEGYTVTWAQDGCMQFTLKDLSVTVEFRGDFATCAILIYKNVMLHIPSIGGEPITVCEYKNALLSLIEETK